MYYRYCWETRQAPLARILVGLVFATSMAMATSLYSTSALGEPVGSRDSTSGEVTTAGVFSTPITISWVIALSNGIYHYMYTISGPTGAGLGVSHFALNLSNDCVMGGTCVTNAIENGLSVESGLTYGANTSANGDTNFPGSFYGVRFFPAVPTQLSIVVQFDSDHAPVYGDFYLKLGQGGPPATSNGDSAWNSGSNPVSNTSGLTTSYIPSPGVASTSAAAPEPSSLFLIGIGLVGLGLVRQRRTKSECTLYSQTSISSAQAGQRGGSGFVQVRVMDPIPKKNSL